MKVKKPIRKHYRLKKDSDDVVFTHREAECIAHMLSGKTYKGTATALKISPRSVESYAVNIKIKLYCRTKSELLEEINNSDFRETAADIISQINKQGGQK